MMAWTKFNGIYTVRIGKHVYTISRGTVFTWIVKRDGETIAQAHRLSEAKEKAREAAVADVNQTPQGNK